MTELKKQLVDLINQTNLPLEAILYVVKDLYRDLDDAFKRSQESTGEEK